MAKTILVTGAAGFLGSHICKELLNRKYEVLGVDNLLGGDKENIPFLDNFYKIIAENEKIERENKLREKELLDEKQRIVEEFKQREIDIESKYTPELNNIEEQIKNDIEQLYGNKPTLPEYKIKLIKGMIKNINFKETIEEKKEREEKEKREEEEREEEAEYQRYMGKGGKRRPNKSRKNKRTRRLIKKKGNRKTTRKQVRRKHETRRRHH